MRGLSRFLCALTLLWPAASLLAGETGSISGTVKDAGGLAVPGATVKVSGEFLPAGRQTVTSASGGYQFLTLLPGSYTVEAELAGLGKAAAKVSVDIDRDVQVTLSLVKSTTAEVTVAAEAFTVDKKSAEVAKNYSDDEIKQLPIPRSYEGLLSLIPGAPATSGNGYVSISGGTRQDNKYLIDGVNISNPSYGFLGINANELDIAEFNVKTSGISAEFGRTQGAIVNAITKSGTNDLKGMLRLVASPSALQADNKYDVTRDSTSYNVAANVGFPILRDTLFGYVSASYSPTTLSGQSSQYGTQPDTKTKNQDYFGKLTGFLGQSLFLNASFRALPTKTDDGFDSLYDQATSAWKSDTTNYVGNASVSWMAAKDTLVEAKYVHLTENDTLGAQNVISGQPTTIDPNNLGHFGSFPDPTRQNGNFGVYEYANFGDVYKRDEIKLTASQFLDLGPTHHQFKVGGGYENTDYNLVRSTNGWGLFTKNVSCPAGVCRATSQPGTVRARFYTLQPEQFAPSRTASFFVQDQATWGRLSVTAGVLLNKEDFSQVVPAEFRGVSAQGTCEPPPDPPAERRCNFMSFGWGDEVQPRLGIAYNAELLPGDKFYGSFGRYTSLDQKSTSRSFAPFRIRQDQSYFDPVSGALLGTQVRGASGGKFIPIDLKAPFMDELTGGYAAPVTRVLAAEISYQYRRYKDMFEDNPVNPDNYGGTFQAQTIAGATRNYHAISLDVTKRYEDRWFASLSYTYSRLRGNFDEEASVGTFNTSSLLEDAPGINSAEPNRDGYLGQDRPHIFKLFASYDLPFGVTLGGFYRFQSGAAWQAQGMDGNGSFLRYLEKAGSRRLPSQSNLDLLTAYTFQFGGDLSLRVEGRLQNVFDTQTAIAVNRTQYFDSYVDGNPKRNLGPQGTSKPNTAGAPGVTCPCFGDATAWTTPRRLVFSGVFGF